MAVRQKLEKLAAETNAPCVTISLNTHRTHPDSEQDRILLKNLLKEAEERILTKYDKRSVIPLLDKISKLAENIDVNYHLDSLHIFLSNDTQEEIKSIWEVNQNAVHVSDKFAVRPLVKDLSRTEEYLILLLSQSGAFLYEAMNDSIVSEVKNDDFPYPEKEMIVFEANNTSDPKQVDNKVREYFNRIDKRLVKVYHETGLKCAVVCTESNFTLLKQIADVPDLYLGFVPVNYNNVAPHFIAKQSWELIQSVQKERRKKAIDEIMESVSEGKVLTDLQEIYLAAIDGRADLLIAHQEYVQPALLNGGRSIELVNNGAVPGAVDDIVSTISWEVLSKKGRVEYTRQEQLGDLGKIALKTRY